MVTHGRENRIEDTLKSLHPLSGLPHRAELVLFDLGSRQLEDISKCSNQFPPINSQSLHSLTLNFES